MPTTQELKQALAIAMLDVAEAGGDEDDLAELVALADDPEKLASLVEEPRSKQLDRVREIAEWGLWPDGRRRAVPGVTKSLERQVMEKYGCCEDEAGELVRAACEECRQKAADEEEQQERLGLIADLVGGTFGDDVMDGLEDEVNKATCKPGQTAARTNCTPKQRPQGSGKRPTAEAKQSAKDALKNAHGQPATPENVGKLVEHLSNLSIKELHDLKRELGLKASGRTKDALMQKLAGQIGKQGDATSSPKRPKGGLDAKSTNKLQSALSDAFSPNDVEDFMHQECNAFAYLLSETMKGQGLAPQVVNLGPPTDISHAMVRVGDQYWDATGVHTLDDVKSDWNVTDDEINPPTKEYEKFGRVSAGQRNMGGYGGKTPREVFGKLLRRMKEGTGKSFSSHTPEWKAVDDVHAELVGLLKAGDWEQAEDLVMAHNPDAKGTHHKLKYEQDRLLDSGGVEDWDGLATELLEVPEKQEKGFRKVQANVGDMVIWNSRTGPTEAEFRGQTTGMDGWEVTLIVRPHDAPPYQITVDADQVQKKSIDKSQDTVYRGVRIEGVEGTQMGHSTNAGTSARVGIGTKRQVKYYIIHWPTEYGGGTANADTLRAAKKRIDDYLGDEDKALDSSSGAAGGFTVPMEYVPEIAEKWYWSGGNPKTRIINRNLERHIMEDYSVDEQQAKALHDAARDYAEQLPTSSEGFYTDEPGQVFQNGSDIQEIGE